MGVIPISNPHIHHSDEQAVYDAIKDTQLSGRSPIVQQFEDKFNEIFGYEDRFAVAVSNGTVAIQLALEGLGLRDTCTTVLVPALGYAAIVNGVLDAGCVPEFVDLEPDSWNIGYGGLLDASDADYALIAHTYGEVTETRHIIPLFKHIIEDCAESLGGAYPESLIDLEPVYCGTYNYAIGTFSFFPNKLMTTGEGGMVTFDESHAENLHEIYGLLNNGSWDAGDYQVHSTGHNMRMSGLQAALGVAQLEHVHDTLFMRTGIMDYYRNELAGVIGMASYQQIPTPWLFGVYTPDEAQFDLQKFLAKNFIESRLPFGVLPEMGPYKRYDYMYEYPNAKAMSESWLFLPSGPVLDLDSQDYVINKVREFMMAGGD